MLLDRRFDVVQDDGHSRLLISPEALGDDVPVADYEIIGHDGVGNTVHTPSV